MGNSTPLPDAETLSRYSTLATRTARDHLQAAKCLLAAGFWGQAHSIAVIGFEELGKACLGMLAMLSPAELRGRFPSGSVGDHGWKLEAAHSALAFQALVRGEGAPLTVEAVAEFDALARDDNKAKQRGLYTDYSADGTLSSPADVTEEQARARVAMGAVDSGTFLALLPCLASPACGLARGVSG